MTNEEIASLLDEAASHIQYEEHNRWYNSNTMLSYEEWRSDLTQQLILKLQASAAALNNE